jgi:hypothetical protein
LFDGKIIDFWVV